MKYGRSPALPVTAVMLAFAGCGNRDAIGSISVLDRFR
jgi:hypothetical protein